MRGRFVYTGQRQALLMARHTRRPETALAMVRAVRRVRYR
jgi:hypothetical protein